MSLGFSVLGPVEATLDGWPLVLGGTRQRALLALLLVRANEVVPGSRLIDEIWGDDPPPSAQNILQGYVSALRKVLGRGTIETRGRGYALLVDARRLDLHRFEALVGRAAREEPVSAASTLHEALALWRGPALADVRDEIFMAPFAARLEELRLLALERRIAADLQCGRHREVVGELEQLIAEHPLRESLSSSLMLALYRAGRQAEALETCRALQRRLADEIGIEPSPAMQRLQTGILRQDASLDLAEPEQLERSLLVALRESDHAETLLDVAASLAKRPPKELIITRSVGRSEELAAAAALAQAERAALIAGGLHARAATFVSSAPARDVSRLALEQDVDLTLLEATPDELARGSVELLRSSSPCNVAVLVARKRGPGPVLVPFVGAEHDWAAVELAAWLALASGVALLLAGPREEDADASRLLAHASLAVQRALGIAAEPQLVAPGGDGLVRAAADAGIVVLGVPQDWRRRGLGEARLALVASAVPPVLLVRRGLRLGGLAPGAKLTRYTWSLGPP
jgi:DNA-binding SARP family transcriptional activator